MAIVNAKRTVLNKDFESTTSFELKEDTFRVEEFQIDLDALKDGEVAVEIIYLSNDPAQRFWICPTDKVYAAGIAEGEKVPSIALGKVIASKNEAYPVDAYLTGLFGWATHTVFDKDHIPRATNVVNDAWVNELWWYLSIVGMTGLTAWTIFFHYAGLQQREEDYGKTFLISGAAGAVGTVSVQLALNVFKAKKVIAIAGGPEKVKYVESFGDRVTCIDYKSPDYKEKLLEAAGGPNTVDYFVDNVGGEILDFSAVKLLAIHGTIIACGSISGYTSGALGFKAYGTVIMKRLTIKGVLVSDVQEKFPQAYKDLFSFISENKLSAENAATIVKAIGDDYKNIPFIWNSLFRGANKGKLITQLVEL